MDRRLGRGAEGPALPDVTADVAYIRDRRRSRPDWGDLLPREAGSYMVSGEESDTPSGTEIEMAGKGNKEVTSPKAATAASKVLSKPSSSKDAKTAAGSALTQKPNRKK